MKMDTIFVGLDVHKNSIDVARMLGLPHTGEPGCALLAAMHAGEISSESLENFLKLREESNFNDMSYAEKRKKDRDVGRYNKSAKKDLRDG